MSERLPGNIRDIAAGQVERLAELAAGLSDADLVAPTLCAGWLAAHLLAHCRQGLAEHAASFADPAGPDQGTDLDYVSYWRGTAPAEPAGYAQVRYAWTTASAYASADVMRRHFADTARAAAGMSRLAPPGTYWFQGHVMTADDILAVWTTEWVIHHFDLTARWPGSRLAPTDEAVALTVRTIDELAGFPERPMAWSAAAYIAVAAGRRPLDHAEQRLFGGTGPFPVLG